VRKKKDLSLSKKKMEMISRINMLGIREDKDSVRGSGQERARRGLQFVDLRFEDLKGGGDPGATAALRAGPIEGAEFSETEGVRTDEFAVQVAGLKRAAHPAEGLDKV